MTVAYSLYLVIGAVNIGFVVLNLPFVDQSEGGAWLWVAAFTLSALLLAPIAIIGTVVRLRAGMERALLILLIATVAFYGIFWIDIAGLAEIDAEGVGGTWAVFYHACHGVIAVALSGWHFIVTRKSLSDRTAE